MSEIIPINAAQGLWTQHKNIKERLGSLSSRLYTLSCQLQKEGLRGIEWVKIMGKQPEGGLK